MPSCPACSSHNIQKRGTRTKLTSNTEYQRYSCMQCNKWFDEELPKVVLFDNEIFNTHAHKYVLTSYQANTQINQEFLQTLKNYSKNNGAEFLILSSDSDVEIDGIRVVSDNFAIGDYLTVYAELNITKTAENPLAGLDGLSKGKSLIVGHPTLQMRTLPVFGDEHPIMLTTTGSISVPEYATHKKAGAKAEHNHSYSALILEFDIENDIFHIRVLNADDSGGFYDLEKYYSGKIIKRNQRADAIIFGDTHAANISIEVYGATFGDGFTNDISLMELLKPKTIIHHDLVDFDQLVSHHNSKSFIKRYQKFAEGKTSVEDELRNTSRFIIDTTPDWVDNVIVVSSNHNDHITVWLDSLDKNHDYINAKLYHLLMYKVLDSIDNGVETNPFQIYFDELYSEYPISDKIKFLGREDLYYIHDILVSSHGDKGTGGSRFSPTQGRKYPSKIVVGHSHSPSINAGAYVTGTSTGKLDYTAGTPSSWMNTHCIIHQNGKRQLVSIIRGKYRL